MKQIFKKLTALTALMVCTATIWAADINFVVKTNGSVSGTGGEASKESTTITLTPASGYYLESITAAKTVAPGQAQAKALTINGNVTITPSDADADLSGATTYSVTMPDNGADVTVTVNFASRVDLSGATVALSASSFTYNGTAQAPTVTGVTLSSTPLTAGTDYTVNSITSQTNVGASYTATVTGKSKYSGTASATWAINKATAVVTPPTNANPTYSGTALPLVSAGSTTFGTLQYSLDGTIYSDAIPTAVTATSYTVYYKVDGTDNYNGAAAQSITATIAQRPLTITAQAQTITYGESIATGIGKVNAVGLVERDALTAITLTPSGTAVTNSGTITPSAAATTNGADNYYITYDTGVLTINAATIEYTADNYSAAYDGAAHGISLNVTTEGTTVKYRTASSGEYNLTEAPTYTDATAAQTVYFQITKDNYTTVESSKTVTISKASISPAVSLNGWTYGSPNDPSVSGNTGNGDVTYSYAEQGSSEWSATKPSSVGEYQVKATVAETANYNGAETAAVNFTITAAAPTVTAPEKVADFTYDGTAHALVSGASVTNGTISYKVGTGEYSTTVPTATAAGSYTVYYKVDGNANYSNVAETEVGTVVVGKATLTVTADDKEIAYGAAAPEFTYTVTGYVAEEDATAAGLSGTPSITTTYNTNDPVNSYPINIAAGTLTVGDNYQLAYQAGSLSVGQSAATVATVPTANALTYNKTAQALVNAGIANGGTLKYTLTENAADEAYSTDIPTATNAGDYTVYYKVFGDANHNNSSVASVPVTIAQKALTITAEAKNKVYGTDDPALTYTSDGLVAGDEITGALARAEGNNVGTYAINQGTLTAGGNYIISYNSADLTITAAAPTVTTPVKAADFTYDGTAHALVSGASVTNGTISYKVGTGEYSTTVPTATAAGSYTVYYKVDGSANYSNVAETEVGTVVISKATLTVTAYNEEINYGEAAPAYTASYSGFVGADDEDVLGGTLAFACAYTAGNAPGTYDIIPSGLTATNYNITFTKGTLTVNGSALEEADVDENDITEDGVYSVPAGVTSIEAGSFAVVADELTSINLTATSITDITVDRNNAANPFNGVSENTLIYLPAGNYAGSEPNVIIDGTCANFIVPSDADLFVPTAFTATNAKVERTFTSGKACTVFLPYVPTISGGTFYKFAGVTGNTANFTEATTELAANTPYIFMPSSDAAEGMTATDVTVSFAGGGNQTNVTDWTFIGSHKEKVWTTDPTTANYAVYGFAGSDIAGVDQGTFVKVGSNITLPARRAYLEYTGDNQPDAPAKSLNGGSPALPETLTVRLINADGTVTYLDSIPAAYDAQEDGEWYDLNGRQLQGKPAAKGIYIHNGKKYIVK